MTLGHSQVAPMNVAPGAGGDMSTIDQQNAGATMGAPPMAPQMAPPTADVRLGVYFGTFDPLHENHVAVVRHATSFPSARSPYVWPDTPTCHLAQSYLLEYYTPHAPLYGAERRAGGGASISRGF